MIVQLVVSLRIVNRQLAIQVPGDTIRECRAEALSKVVGDVWLEVWSTDEGDHVATRVGEHWHSNDGRIEAPV